MSRASFALLILGLLMVDVISSTITVRKYCKKNEEVTTCGSACPPSCESPKPHCVKKCVTGCQCKQGYLRNFNGRCVLPAECDATKGAVNKTVTKGPKKLV